MTTTRVPGTFTVRTLILAMASFSLAFGLLTWTAIRPLVLPLAIAILLYWFGAVCMSIGERRFAGSRAVLLLGCVAMSSAVVIGFFGTAFIAGLWAISAMSS